MKKHIYISFFLILFSQCSSLEDSREIFLNDFKGAWKTTPQSQPWFNNNLTTVVTPGTPVNVASNGFFTVVGTPNVVVFTFIEIEKNGILAVYKIVTGTKTVYAGIGFGQKDDILITSSVVSSPDLVVSTDQGTDQGEIFLIK